MNFPSSLNALWRATRFNSYNRMRRDVIGARVYKIGLRLDFTCPNCDGTVAVGGCIYCNNASHKPQAYRCNTIFELRRNRRRRMRFWLRRVCSTDLISMASSCITCTSSKALFWRSFTIRNSSRDEDVALVSDFLELLNLSIVVHRLSRKAYRAITMAPEWSIDKFGVHNAITKALEQRDTWQGRLFAREPERIIKWSIARSLQGVTI